MLHECFDITSETELSNNRPNCVVVGSTYILAHAKAVVEPLLELSRVDPRRADLHSYSILCEKRINLKPYWQ